MDQLIYVKYSDARALKFQIRTEIWEDSAHHRYVKKYPLNSESKQHIENMLGYYTEFERQYKDAGISLCPCSSCDDGVSFEFLEGQGLSSRIDACFKNGDKQAVEKIIDRYVEFLNKVSHINMAGERVISHANLDLIFDNIIEKDNQWSIIDYEWTFNTEILTEFILYRAIFYDVHHSANYDGSEDYFKYAGISADKQKIYAEYEVELQKYIAGESVNERSYSEQVNIINLMSKKIWERENIYFKIYKDYGAGFNEDNTMVVPAPVENGKYKMCIPYDKAVIRYRVDPGENPIALQLGYPVPDETNGISLDEESIFFSKNDPWIIINNPVGEVCLSGSICSMDDIVMPDMIMNRINKDNNITGKYAIRVIKDKVEQKAKEKITHALKRKSDEELPDIAVHLHLFYVDLLDEFVEFFNNIPVAFDLFISCVDGKSVEYIKQKSSQISNVRKVTVRKMKNRGRDIAPLYVGFGSEIKNYKYFLHVHSKKSKHIKEGGADWRQYSLRALVGSDKTVARILSYFENGSNVGLVYPNPDGYIPATGYTWLGNKDAGKAFLESIGCEFVNGLISYPAGSFFWARTDAIHQLFDMNMKLGMFPKEAGQVDGTFAHVLERALDGIIKKNGYCSYVVSDAGDEYEIGFPVNSKTIFDLLHPDRQQLLDKLMKYDTISISVMETLFSTAVWDERDIVELTMDKFGLDNVAVEYRLEAEKIARENRGSAATLDDVYHVLEQISPFDALVCEEMKAQENKVFLEKIRPRKDMVEIFRSLMINNKRILLLADTIYRKDIIQAALIRCGYIGFSELYVCSEFGMGLAEDDFWRGFFEEIEKSEHIHIGTDVYADWYMLEKFQANSCWIPSIDEQFRLLDTGYYNKIPYIGKMERLELAEYAKGQKYSKWT